MAEQVRERGEPARRLPPALRHGQSYLVPFPVVQSVGLQLCHEASKLEHHMAESFEEVLVCKVCSVLQIH